MKDRTKKFALAIMLLAGRLPRNRTSDIVGRQLLRSATSVGANYRSACRARSRADFISKITIVEEEADESVNWLELLLESGIVKDASVFELIKEGRELTAVFSASAQTAKKNKQQ